MDIVTTSLEALIQRATCNQNQCQDNAAIDAFCGLINKEPECVQIATKFITAKVHSLHSWEALQALLVLDTCMKRCGSNFHAEVGKFRFLNELIKLVSPKYAGAHTPEPVKRRVLELMQSWTVIYPKEHKIKEAYEMLKKQGVVKEEIKPPQTLPPPQQHQDSIFQDTEKSRLLQKLLQSKNPEDLQAANRLIKTMVKEDERRVEIKSRHLSEIEAAHNNARLLSEMLQSYSRDMSSPQDLELINELHASCLRYRPNVQKLLSEVHDDERLFNEVLAANDELGEVIDKYSAVLVSGAGPGADSLLDLSPPAPPAPPSVLPVPDAESLLCDNTTSLDLNQINMDVPKTSYLDSVELLSSASNHPPQQPLSDLSSLGDIFGSVSQPVTSTLLAATHSPLRPEISEKAVDKKTGLEELDALSESLLRQNLPSTFQPLPRAPAKVSMNELSLSQNNSPLHCSPALQATPAASVALVPTLLDNGKIDLLSDKPGEDFLVMEAPQVNGNTCIVDISPQPEPLLEVEETPVKNCEKDKTTVEVTENTAVRSLGDINVTLDSIKPGNLPPLTVVEERGISVKIHFGRDSPRPDVSVFVVTTTSSSQSPVTNYLFQAIVPKGCKMKLQAPSCTDLPAHNPFLPPAAITQVMLVASASRKPILLRVVVSFNMDDETITEMKEIESFPLLCDS